MLAAGHFRAQISSHQLQGSAVVTVIKLERLFATLSFRINVSQSAL